MVVQSTNKDVGEDIKSFDKIELLENHGAARTPGSEPLSLEGSDIDVAPINRAARGFDQTVDEVQECRFAGT